MTTELTHPIKIRERLQHYASQNTPETFDLHVLGAIVGTFNRFLRMSDKDPKIPAMRRRQVFGYLFTPDNETIQEIHSRNLSPGQSNGLLRWMGGSWNEPYMRAQFKAELGWVWDCTQHAFQLAKTDPGICMNDILVMQFNQVTE